jgi:hypothetical protein
VTRDPDGNVLSVTTAEPRFTRDEVALLLASRRAENAPRGEHGLLLSEAMDPKNQFAFETTPPVMDWAQKTLNDARAAYRKKSPDADMTAVQIRVRKRD